MWGTRFTDMVEDYGNIEKDHMVRDINVRYITQEKDDYKREVRTLYYLEGFSERDINVSLGLKCGNPHQKEKLTKALQLRVN